MAANWLEILLTAPELNDQNAGSLARVSSKPKLWWMNPYASGVSSRGGMSGKNAKPMSARPVAMPMVLRHRG